MRLRLPAAFALILLVCQLVVAAPPPSAPLAIVDVSVIPMDTDRVLTHQTVLFRDGKIVAIAPSRSTSLPPGAQRIDGRGKFLMPGLIDAHVHLMSPDDLISYLAYGVTTVVNMSGTPSDLKMRHDVRAGTLLGPNIYTAGPTIDGYPPLNEVFVTAETPEQGDALVVDHKRQGYDFIKVYGTLRPEVFHDIAAACAREHITLTGHINRQVPTSEVLAAGQVLAAHSDDLLAAHFDHPPTNDELAAFAEEIAKTGITVTANIAINPATVAQVQNLDQVLASDEAQYLSAATYSRWIRANNRNLDEDPKQHLENLQQQQTMDLSFVRLLHQHHVPLILGTDASGYGFPGQSAWEEIKQTELAGLTRFEALATATRNSGAYLSRHIDTGSHIGTITEGSTADLLLLNENPLTSELKLDSIAGIILRGRWIPQSELDRLRRMAKQRFAAEHATANAIDAALEKGEVKTARELYQRAHSTVPLLDEWVLLTKARKHEGEPSVAVDIARLNTEQFPDRFSSHQLLADLLQKSGQNAASRAESEAALKEQPHCATALNLLRRATFAASAPTFAATDYQLQFGPNQPAARLHLERQGNTWTGSLLVDKDTSLIRSVIAGADQLWFKAGQDWQEKELRLTITPNGQVSGSWWSMFGHNGNVTGARL